MSQSAGREWMPHVWEGANLYAWCRLLITHRFRVHPKYFYVLAIASLITCVHSAIWLIQEAFQRHKMRRVPRVRDPIFILGHWRSGTTLLHEMLIRDPRFCFPTTSQCFDPNHFLLTQHVMPKIMPFLMPTKRPMDDMPTGWDRPQEDEFALCLMGQPSPYEQIGFPNDPFRSLDALDQRGFSEKKKARWAGVLAEFLSRVASQHPGKRMVLKSPPHMARIPALVQQFPEARFIHIVRDPLAVYPSTLKLWKSLYRYHELQVADGTQLEPYVLECGRRMFAAFEAGRSAIPPGRLIEVRYEDMVADPERVLTRVYRAAGLGEFMVVREHLSPMIDEIMSHKPRRREPSEAERDAVLRHWGDVRKRYGYEQEAPVAPTPRRTAARADERPAAVAHTAKAS